MSYCTVENTHWLWSQGLSITLVPIIVNDQIEGIIIQEISFVLHNKSLY